MSAEKSLAIVLKVVEFSESSCIVTFLTRGFGKITAIAKGARRRKSPFEGALDLLSISRIVFLHKKSEALDLLTEAKLQRRFRSASVDLDRLYTGYYIAELLDKLTDEGDPHSDLYDLACENLYAIDDGADAMLHLLRFELGALRTLGHQPMLNRCVGCGREKELKNKNVQFGLKLGGILCPDCRKGKTSVVNLSSTTWKNLTELNDIEPSEFDQNRGEMRQFMNQYIAHHLGHRPRMHQYLTGSRN